MSVSPQVLKVDQARVLVFDTKVELGQVAAAEAVEILRRTVAHRGLARLVVAGGNSQLELIHALVRTADVPWDAVEVLHMDEYVGIPATHPCSLRLWVKHRLADVVRPWRMHYLEGDAGDLAAECNRYTGLLQSDALDLCFVGFGENGHIAFNDPHAADFRDPFWVKLVVLDERCRLQQVGEGHFPDLSSVPPRALTLTCPALLSAERIISCVPDLRKAEAVQRALEGPVSTQCPASIVRTHPGASIYLDRESASHLTLANLETIK